MIRITYQPSAIISYTMYVPNYIPEPLEVPGNVSEEPYDLRLAFIRRVGTMYMMSLAAIAGMVIGMSLLPRPLPRFGLGPAFGALAVLLIGLELMRIAMRGSRREASYSTAMLPLVLGIAAWTVRELELAGFPVWALVPGPIAATVYGALCGRDFSFVGCWVLSMIASSVWIGAAATTLGLPPRDAALALGGNAAFLSYLVYDLASLLSRRRLGEAPAAVVDLYRDVFNLFGYVTRVIAHWRKHRIWR